MKEEEFEPFLDRVKTKLCDAANTYFSQIHPDEDNDNLLLRTIEQKGFAEYIARRLATLEDLGEYYWSDKELSEWIEARVQDGTLITPTDPVDKSRWLALVFMIASSKIGFPYGNMVCAADFLPEDSSEFDEYVERVGSSVLEDIRERRKALREGKYKL